MKYNHYILAFALVAAVTIPGIAGAQSVELQTSASIKASSTGPGVLQKMRTEVKVKGENVKANQDSRNDLIRKMSTSTASSTNVKREIQKNAQQNIKTLRTEVQSERKLATSSEARREFRADMELRMFQIRKEILVRQLNLALANLKQIRGRIVSRIEKAEQSGRNMTEARTALVAADAKLGVAQTQINMLANLSTSTLPVVTPVATTTASTTASTSVQVKLEKPRQLGEAAIKAVKDARDALNLVVRAIAKNMGLGNGQGTTTPATTTPSVSPTVTTTPSVPPTPTATSTPTNTPVATSTNQ